MVKIIIILSFISCIAGGIISCATTDVIEMKPETVELVGIDSANRLMGNQWQTKYFWIYKDQNNTLYRLEADYGKQFVLNVKR